MNFFDSNLKKYNDQYMKFSLEIGPQTDLDTVPQVKDVYITMLPGGDYRETAQQAVELVKKGFKIGRAHVRTPVTSQSRMPSSA